MSGTYGRNGAYEFGEFRVEVVGRSLTRNGEAVAITGKPFDALVYLIEHPGTVVRRDELAKALWPSTVVEDNNLSQTILALRRVLGETQDAPGFIATVPRRGYQFVAEVRASLGTEERPKLASNPARSSARVTPISLPSQWSSGSRPGMPGNPRAAWPNRAPQPDRLRPQTY